MTIMDWAVGKIFPSCSFWPICNDGISYPWSLIHLLYTKYNRADLQPNIYFKVCTHAQCHAQNDIALALSRKLWKSQVVHNHCNKPSPLLSGDLDAIQRMQDVVVLHQLLVKKTDFRMATATCIMLVTTGIVSRHLYVTFFWKITSWGWFGRKWLFVYKSDCVETWNKPFPYQRNPIARGKNLLALLQSIYYSQNSEKNRDCMEPRKTKGIKKLLSFHLLMNLSTFI